MVGYLCWCSYDFSVIAVCLYGFLPRHPKDYSYLAEYEPVATVNMDDVVLENEAELCYTTH